MPCVGPGIEVATFSVVGAIKTDFGKFCANGGYVKGRAMSAAMLVFMGSDSAVREDALRKVAVTYQDTKGGG